MLKETVEMLTDERKVLNEVPVMRRKLENLTTQLNDFVVESATHTLKVKDVFANEKFMNKDDFSLVQKALVRTIGDTQTKLAEMTSRISLLSDEAAAYAKKTDISEMETKTKSLIEKTISNCKKLFANRIETKRDIKTIKDMWRDLKETQEKTVEYPEKWLLAKKGYNCGSCDSYIGDLKESTNPEFWNKYPIREGDKIYRAGNNFSKILQNLKIETIKEEMTYLHYAKTEQSFMKHKRQFSVETRNFMRPKLRDNETKETASDQLILETLEPKL